MMMMLLMMMMMIMMNHGNDVGDVAGEDVEEDDNAQDEVEEDKVDDDYVEKNEDNDVEDDDVEEDEEKDENVAEDEVKENDVAEDEVDDDDDVKGDEDGDVRACAVEMHFSISHQPAQSKSTSTFHKSHLTQTFTGKNSQEPLDTEIYRKNAAAQLEHPGQAPAFTPTVRTPQCGHTVWATDQIEQLFMCLVTSVSQELPPIGGCCVCVRVCVRVWVWVWVWMWVCVCVRVQTANSRNLS